MHQGPFRGEIVKLRDIAGRSRSQRSFLGVLPDAEVFTDDIKQTQCMLDFWILRVSKPVEDRCLAGWSCPGVGFDERRVSRTADGTTEDVFLRVAKHVVKHVVLAKVIPPFICGVSGRVASSDGRVRLGRR